eukprot:TRINITY_DN9239_c0_g2_i2.p1 TRINITY_DN9239_c0_g2~~TRINITY_DN9239_c0_g2_i2.p1  ORF type:complete len:741 (+),score=164.15 TRINITY_DN9239_c0_g2_i2:161-2383(+)
MSRTVKRDALSLKDIRNMTNIQEIEKLYAFVCNEAQEMSSKMEDIELRKQDVQIQIDVLSSLPIKLQPIQQTAYQLCSSLADTAKLAESVSLKARELDKIMERVGQATKYVQEIVDLNECIEGIQDSLEKKMWEKAAGFIQRYLQIDSSLLDENSESILTLKQAQTRLNEIVEKGFSTALEKLDVPEIIRYSKLFLPLGRKEEGLRAYASYLRKLVDSEALKLFQSVAQSRRDVEIKMEGSVNYVVAFGKILQIAEIKLKEEKKNLDTFFGPGGIFFALVEMQKFVCSNCVQLIALFIEDWKVQEQLNLSSKLHPSTTATGGMSNKSMSDLLGHLPALLSQMTGISQAHQLHKIFVETLRKACEDAISKLGTENSQQNQNSFNSVTTPLAPSTPPIITLEMIEETRALELETKMQDMMSNYLYLEKFFMHHSVKNAMVLTQSPSDSNFLISVMDETFFVLQESANRTKESHDADSTCALINMVVEILDDTYYNFFLKFADVRSISRDIFTRSLVGLNCVESTVRYLGQLKHSIETPCRKYFQRKPQSLQKILACLESFRNLERKFRNLLQGNIEGLSISLKPKLSQQFSSLASISYDLTQQKFTENKINDPFMENFLLELNQMIVPYKNVMNEACFDLLMQSLAKQTVENFEKSILKKKVNIWGGKQFNKEFMDLLGFFTTQCKKSVRDKFVRIQQISQLLTVEEKSEVEELKGEWACLPEFQLTDSEIQMILQMRTDYL